MLNYLNDHEKAANAPLLSLHRAQGTQNELKVLKTCDMQNVVISIFKC